MPYLLLKELVSELGTLPRLTQSAGSKRPLTRRRMAATLSPRRGKIISSFSRGEKVAEGRGRMRGLFMSFRGLKVLGRLTDPLFSPVLDRDRLAGTSHQPGQFS